jgi:REP-associated tyrosine transposase
MPFYRLFYHFVWTTKNRLPLITPDNQEPIYGSIRAKTQELNGIVHALNSMPDHVHLLVTIPPTIALAEFMRQVKGSSSHLASHLPSAQDPFAWQSEYGVLSISESHLPAVVRYVECQQQHHADQSLDQRLEAS